MAALRQSRTPLCLHLKSAKPHFSIYVFVLRWRSHFFLTSQLLIYIEKQKIVSSNRRTQKSRMVETTNDSGQKGPPEHKIEEKVATRESEMVSRASRAVSPLAAIKGVPPRSPQGASLVITSAGHSQSNSSHAYLRLEQWKGGLRASWRKTDPQEKSLESRGWRNRSPPQRSCINRHRGSLC